MHPTSWLPRTARGPRACLAALVALLPVVALASAHAISEPEVLAPERLEARAGAPGVAGSGGAAGSSGDGLGGGGFGGRAGSSGRDGARPLDGSLQMTPATIVAHNPRPTTLRRGVQLENGSEQAPGDQAGSPPVFAPTADLMVITNGSCGDEADQVGVAPNPRDRAP